MNLTEYNAMPDGDLKLAVRLAITMGWTCQFAMMRLSDDYKQGDLIVFDENPKGYQLKKWSPFTDASIPYGLPVDTAKTHDCWVAWINTFEAFFDGRESRSPSKTHAILNAFCAADPSGHWAEFLKGE